MVNIPPRKYYDTMMIVCTYDVYYYYITINYYDYYY